MRRFMAAVSVAAVMTLGTSAAFAGEITGNGKLKPVNGNSPCAFSGQEDLQWYTDDSDATPRTDPTKGDPAHSQNWGHVKQATGAVGGANSTDAFGFPWGCNAHEFGLKN
jgi:hypothetical protein